MMRASRLQPAWAAGWALTVLAPVLFSGCMEPWPGDEEAERVGEVQSLEPLVSRREGGMPAGSWPTVADFEAATGRSMGPFRQSPMLDDRGLAPVGERLPLQPMVVKPVERVGAYGGTLRILRRSPEKVEIRNLMAPATILGYDRDFKSMAPALARAWEFSDGGRTLTLHFREGLRWSDGQPFTTDDVMFWYEDIMGNDEIMPVKPAQWKPGGELMEMEQVDAYTLRLRFSKPYPVIVNRLCIPHGVQGAFFQCKHYMKQFHPRYRDRDELEAEAQAAGFQSWVQYFGSRSLTPWTLGSPTNEGCPTLDAYQVTRRLDQMTAFERNPYFWKVDPEGNQLPYIDRVNAYYVASKEVYKLKILSGQVDFDVGLYTLSVEDIPLLKQNEEQGNYRTLLWRAGWAGVARYAFNLNCPDAVKAEIFNQVAFRQALSLALDRDAMNEGALFGRGYPQQASVLPNPEWSSYYEPHFGTAYAQYDPAEAQRLLDGIGLRERDGEGYRLMPDGRRLTVILLDDNMVGARGAFFELTREYWGDVGVELIVKAVDFNLRRAKLDNGDFELMAWHIDGILDISFEAEPFPFVPITRATCWGPQWYRWYNSNGREGLAPPPKVMELYEALGIMHTTMDREERIQAGKRILQSQADNLWNIGTVGFFPWPLIAHRDLRNVPACSLWTWDCFHTFTLPPEAFFFDRGDAGRTDRPPAGRTATAASGVPPC